MPATAGAAGGVDGGGGGAGVGVGGGGGGGRGGSSSSLLLRPQPAPASLREGQETPKRQTYRNGNEAKVPSEVRAINSYICVWAVLSLDLNFPISVSPLADKSTCSYSTAGAIVIITDSLRGITHSIQHFPPKPKQCK